MKSKNILILVIIALIAIVDISIYISHHLTQRGMKAADEAQRAALFERAVVFNPGNFEAYAEMGDAYFTLGTEALEEPETAEELLHQSVNSFRRALRLNPADKYHHFNYAQALEYWSIFDGGHPDEVTELKRAAMLAGHTSEIYFEAGKELLTRWEVLSQEERAFTADILRRIMSGREGRRFEEILQVWALNGADYAAMERILPRDPEILSKYAEFLGRRSLSLSARQEALVEAETLQFEEIQETCRLARNEFDYFDFKEAEKLFRKALNQMHGIRFYQNLYDNHGFDAPEYQTLFRDVHKYLSLCRIQQGDGLEEVEKDLTKYLELEDSVAAVAELEEYLVEEGLIGESIDAELRDLGQLSFHLKLYTAQNQYRDIMRLGRSFESSFMVVPKEQQDRYVEVMRLVGTAFLRADFIYEAGEYLDKALAMDPDNLHTLVRKRDYHLRLNEQDEAAEVQARIDAVIAPHEIDIRRGELRAGRIWSREWLFDGSGVEMTLEVAGANFDVIPPLVTVVFNGRVVWEDYLQDGKIRFAAESRTGINVIGIEAVNRDAELTGVTWEVEE